LTEAQTLSAEVGIVWIESPAGHDYVRETFYPCDSPDGPPDFDGCRDTVENPGKPGTRRIVGYSTLSPDAFGPPWLRRIFWLKPYDRTDDPNGTYRRGNKPWEGVDPLTVRPGEYGQHNARAWGIPGND
jgi:hypothetical protein